MSKKALYNAAIAVLEEKLFKIAENFFQGVDPAHDINHVRRVLNIAKKMCEIEGADLQIVISATILHDIGRANERLTGQEHQAWGAVKAKKILKKLEIFTEEQIEHICNCILEHRGSKDTKCTSLESKILKDSDKIDALGLTGLVRAHAYGSTIMQPFYTISDINGTEEEEEVYTVHKEIKYKLLSIYEKMETETGKKIAKERSIRLEQAFDILNQEIKGIL